jgi:dihydrofolate reductase
MVSFIVAVADNGVMGKQGAELPWRQSADLVRYREITMGHPIIMGRKTYESIGHPLPGRQNIIVTRNPAYRAEGCTVATSLEAALQAANDSDEIFIIGGGMLFAAAMPLADKLYLTQIHAKPDGDVFFQYDPADWQEIEHESYPADAKNQYPYSFVTFTKVQDRAGAAARS